MSRLRLFIGIRICEKNIPQWQQAEIKLKKEIKNREYETKWTLPGNYHITLQFLGDQTESQIPILEEIMKKLSLNFPPFELEIQGVDAFANVFDARVLYLGVQNKKILRALHSDLEQLIAERFQIYNDHKNKNIEFQPHLTILRFRNPHAVKDLISPFVRKKWGSVKVTEMVLYKSELRGIYPVYTPLLTVPLTGEERTKDNP